MFYRSKFVTNSSSTSFISFGIWISPQDKLLDLCEFFTRKYPSEAEDILIERCYLDPGEKDLEEFRNDPKGFLSAEGADRDFLAAFLEKEGLSLEGDYESDTFYICIGYPKVFLDSEGVAYIKDPEALKKGYNSLKKLMKEWELTDKKIIELQDSWYS